MNRREAIATLLAMPEIAKISVAPVRPSDVLVVECTDLLSSDTMERIAAHVQRIWPGQKVLVLDKGLTLKVVAGA